MKIIELEQNTPEWLEFRKSKVGASDAPIIMNFSPWSTPYKLWRQKLDLDPPIEENQYMRRGKELEPVAREYLEKEWGHNFCPVVGQSLHYHWMIASFDAWSPDLNHYVEIKCSGPKDHEDAKNGIIPSKYIPQLLHQMLVANINKITYMSFDGENGVFIDLHISQFQDYVIQEHINKTKEFYDCLMNLTSPKLTDKDYNIREDEEWKILSTNYRIAKSMKEEYELKEKEAREKLIELSGGLNTKGMGITVSKITSRGVIDYSSIDEIKNLDLEKYRKPSKESWRINIT